MRKLTATAALAALALALGACNAGEGTKTASTTSAADDAQLASAEYNDDTCFVTDANGNAIEQVGDCISTEQRVAFATRGETLSQDEVRDLIGY